MLVVMSRMYIQSYLTLLKQYLPYISITLVCWLTYAYTLSCGFCSDDLAGIAEYDGKLQGWEYGMLWRWVRYHICGGNFPSQNKDQVGKPIPQGKLPIRHHFLSIFVLNITSLVTYIALKPIIGEWAALLSVLIFIVHPCTTQGVAWISGLAYPLSLLWISSTILLMQFFYAHQTLNHAIWVIPTFCIIQFLAIHAIFATTAMTWALLLFLGYWQFAILAFILSVIMCFDQIRKTINLRIDEFKKQNMEQSTVIGPGKIVVMAKTLAYYICHSIAPIKMGLYHEWGFHYSKDIERRDWRFWAGFAALCAMTYIFFTTDIIGIKLGILWYLIFSAGFLNLITAQQFVTERYIMLANLGLGMIIATLTYNYFWVYSLIFGLYLCRTWTHLPSYDNELRFYQSNNWNFPKSEVALGNLGVTYARLGLIDTAKDTWLVSTQINPEYDVPWVNIFYQFRTKGTTFINNGEYIRGLQTLQEGLPFLEKAISCKVCHFPEMWKKEHQELLAAIKNPSKMFQDEFKRLISLRESLKSQMTKAVDAKRVSEVQESITNNERQIDNLLQFIRANNLQVDQQSFNFFNSNKLLDKLTRR